MPHQTAVQEHFLLDIIASGSLDAFNGISNATATKHSGNWYMWCTLIKHTGITDEFLGGYPTRAEETLMSSFAASVRRNQFGTTRKRILQKGDIRFYRKRRELFHDIGIIHLADKVSPTFHTQKNRVKNATVTQWRTTTTLCPVNIWSEIIIQLDSYSGTTSDTPVNMVWVERHKTTIISQMTTNSPRAGTLSFGEERLVFSHKEVGTTPYGQGSP